MPRKKKPELDGDAIAKAIATDLPGWHLARKRSVDDAVKAETASQAQPAATLKTLRKKFIGPEADTEDDPSDAGDGAEDYGTLSADRVTVEVEPDSGGAAKVADIVKGKMNIVQG